MSREIVIPGEHLGNNPHMMGQNVYVLDGNVYASVLGIKNERENEISVVPLKGKYTPMENDTIVGVVKSEKFSGYEVEINSFYSSYVSKKELRDPLKVGTIVTCKIMKVNELNEADIGFVRPMHDGEIVMVTPARVPRIIGKNNSMLNVVKNGTGSTVFVGKNGMVFISSGNVELAKEVLHRIDENAHVENLTLDTQKFLAVKTGAGLPSPEGAFQDDGMGSQERGFDSGPRSYGGGYGNRSSFGGTQGGFRPRNNFRSPGGFGSGGGYGGNRSYGNRSSFGGNRPSFGGGNRRPYGSDRGSENSGGDFPRPMRRSFGPRNFESNRGFGNNYSQPPAQGPPQGFDRRKRFPQDNHNAGNEDPDFE